MDSPPSRPRWIRWIGRLALAALGWLVACTLATAVLTHRLRSPSPEPAPTGYDPERIVTSDGLELGAWYQPGGKDAVLILHGDEASRSAMAPQTPPYREAEASLLLVSLRAHGDSEGRVNDFGWGARHDVVAAVDFLEKKGHERIFIDGVSLGAAAAVFAGAELSDRVDGYILECPYQDLHHAVDARTHMFLPPGVATLATRTLEWVSPLCIEDYREISLVRHIAEIPPTTPILILGGEQDVYAPAAQLEAIAAAAPQAQLVFFPDTGHNELRRKNQQRYDDLVTAFLRGEKIAKYGHLSHAAR